MQVTGRSPNGGGGEASAATGSQPTLPLPTWKDVLFYSQPHNDATLPPLLFLILLLLLQKLVFFLNTYHVPGTVQSSLQALAQSVLITTSVLQSRTVRLSNLLMIILLLVRGGTSYKSPDVSLGLKAWHHPSLCLTLAFLLLSI